MNQEDEQRFHDRAAAWGKASHDAWRDWLSGGAAGAGPAAAWAAPFSAWLRSTTPDADPQAKLAAARFTEQGRRFMALAEALGRLLADPPPTDADATAWHERIAAAFAPLHAALDAEAQAARDGPFGAAQPLADGWQVFVERLFPDGLPTADGAAAPLAEAQDLLVAAGRFRARLVDVQRLAVERCEATLAARLAAGDGPDGVRGLYELWVDAGEAAYAEVVGSGGYAEDQAALVAGLCRLHAVLGRATGDAATLRGALDTALDGNARLRAELERLRDELGNAAASGNDDGAA